MTPAEKAKAAKGPVMAMRMAENWMTELSEGDLTDERARDLDRGLAVLQERYPEITDYPGSAENFAQSRGHGRGSRGGRSHEGRRRSANKKKTSSSRTSTRASSSSKETAKKGRAASSPSRGPGRPRRSSSVSPRYSSRRLYAQTGIPGATWSATSLTMSVLGATIGLSLLYLMLTSAEQRGSGQRGLPFLLGAITGFMQRLVSTRDILGEGASIDLPPGASPALIQRLIAGQPIRPSQSISVLPHVGQLPKPNGRNVPIVKGSSTLPANPGKLRSIAGQGRRR